MPRRIFISYRREDCPGHTGRARDRLVREFRRNYIFMDVDGIGPGANFVKRLTAEVASCDVLLAVIGPRWNTSEQTGTRRLDNPNDFVRIEIRAALQRDIPVIPILVDGAKMPSTKELPGDVSDLALRNGLEVRDTSFHADMGRLVRELDPAFSRKFSRPIYATILAVLWLIGSIIGFLTFLTAIGLLEDFLKWLLASDQHSDRRFIFSLVTFLVISLFVSYSLINWLRARTSLVAAGTIGFIGMLVGTILAQLTHPGPFGIPYIGFYDIILTPILIVLYRRLPRRKHQALGSLGSKQIIPPRP